MIIIGLVCYDDTSPVTIVNSLLSTLWLKSKCILNLKKFIHGLSVRREWVLPPMLLLSGVPVPLVCVSQLQVIQQVHWKGRSFETLSHLWHVKSSWRVFRLWAISHQEKMSGMDSFVFFRWMFTGSMYCNPLTKRMNVVENTPVCSHSSTSTTAAQWGQGECLYWMCQKIRSQNRKRQKGRR